MMVPTAARAVSVAAALLSAAVEAAPIPDRSPLFGSTPYPDHGFEFSGYGCRRECGPADVTFEIAAELATYLVPGATSDNSISGVNQNDAWNGDASAYTRTLVGVSGPFCDSGNGTEGPLGPCLAVQPGQLVAVKLINRLANGMELLDQQPASKEVWWDWATDVPNGGLDPISLPARGPNKTLAWFGEPAESSDKAKVPQVQNLPGHDVSFDVVNLHFHGMQVVPHLFFPQGTTNPTAPWIGTTPPTVPSSIPGEDTECFCYALRIPEDHPQGTFWYHVHRHGAVAMQGWQGMVGELQVQGPKSPQAELAAQGVTHSLPFFVWEWPFDTSRIVENTPATFYEANFLDGGGPVVFAPVNNRVRPTYKLNTNETTHLRMLNAMTTMGLAIYVEDPSGDKVPIWNFASDGISYDRAYQREMMVIGPGQREGVLLQFDQPGMYTVMQAVLNDFQDQGGGPEGDGELVYPQDYLPLAYFEVTDGESVTPVDLPALRFTPGMSSAKSIAPKDVVHQAGVNFQVFSQLGTIPAPQFVIDGEGFDYARITKTQLQGTAVEWQLTSNMNYYHPFHIHVNPFQVKQVVSGWQSGPPEFQLAFFQSNMVPINKWRDTVFIPPYGISTIWQRFDEAKGSSDSSEAAHLFGKTVFHCHFLDHEDQGMIAAFMITHKELREDAEEQSSSRRSRLLSSGQDLSGCKCA